MPQFLRDAQHLVRLALLFLAGILVFVVARAFLVPPGFGQLGHFRPGAMADNRQRQPAYAGRSACADCHDSAVTTIAGGAHKNLSCEACHGPLATHAADPDKSSPPKVDVGVLCARCHSENPARPGKHPQVAVADHAQGASCLECHKAHAPTPE